MRLSDKEYLTCIEHALDRFNSDYIFLNKQIEISNAGIGSDFETYLLKALNICTSYTWRLGNKETEVDFICIDNPLLNFELKTCLSNTFTGGCVKGREQQLKNNPTCSNKYSLIKNDNGKICIYDNINYLFIALDRPHNGFNQFYIKKIMCGPIKEIDWNTNRNLKPQALSSLHIIQDNTKSIDRWIRCPWSQSNKQNSSFLKSSLLYLITQVYDENFIEELEKNIDDQKNFIKRKKIDTVINNALQYVSKDELIQELTNNQIINEAEN